MRVPGISKTREPAAVELLPALTWVVLVGSSLIVWLLAVWGAADLIGFSLEPELLDQAH
jgi:hypothetical protein